MYNLYLYKGNKKFLLRNVANEERPIVERVLRANGWQVLVERIDGDD